MFYINLGLVFNKFTLEIFKLSSQPTIKNYSSPFKIEKEGAHFMTSGYVSKLEIERKGFQSCMKLHKNAVLDFRKSMLEEAKETSSKWSTKSLFRLDGVTAV